MGSNDRVWIVIPAYNEARSVARVLSSLKAAGYANLVVVDDGGSDRTAAIASRLTDHVLTHIINRGQGAALKTGIDYALSQGAEVIVTFDADGQHDVKDIPRMVRPIMDGECQVTLGSRFLRKTTKIPLFRKVTLKGAVLFMRVVYGVKLSDAHNGFRALSRQAAQSIDIRSNRMEHASEIVDEIFKKRISYREVPVTIHYSTYARMKGQSSLNSINIACRLLVRRLLR
ncbi:MAG: glycosyltransferase family 2 protein [Nanoarchaeota archaeon]